MRGRGECRCWHRLLDPPAVRQARGGPSRMRSQRPRRGVERGRRRVEHCQFGLCRPRGGNAEPIADGQVRDAAARARRRRPPPRGSPRQRCGIAPRSGSSRLLPESVLVGGPLTELAGAIGQDGAGADRGDPRLLRGLWTPERLKRTECPSRVSGWARVGPQAEQRAVRSLRDDLASGRWAERNHDLAALDAAELGLRLLMA